MRPMTRLARRAQASMRRPPQARWVAPARQLGLVLGCMFLVGLMANLLWRSQPVQIGLASARSGILTAMQAGGLVVENVAVSGNSYTDSGLVRRLLESYRKQNILAVDIEAIRARLERLPWVDEASVSRLLPGTLRIRLVEHRPVARWSDGVRQVLVSEAGGIIPVPSTQRFEALPLLAGPGAPQRARALLAVLGREPELARRVSSARLVGGRRWNVYIDGRIEVRLPEREPEDAWQRLAAQQRATALLGRAIKAIDLRHSAWLSLELASMAPDPGA